MPASSRATPFFRRRFLQRFAELARIALKRSPLPIITCRSAADRALAGGFPRRVAAAATGRDGTADAAAVWRARSASTRRWRRGRRGALSAAAAGSSSTAPTGFRGAGARNSNWPRTSGSPMCRSIATRRVRLSRRWQPVFRHAVHWTGAVSVTNPLALTRAYAARFAALGGLTFSGDARTLHRANPHWRVETASGPLDTGDVVIALGPWAPDVSTRSASGCRSRSSAAITAITGRKQRRAQPSSARCRERLRAGADGAGYPDHHRRRVRRARCGADAGAIRSAVAGGARVVSARGAVEPQPWLGARPCFPDSRPVIARAPRSAGLWLAIGHAHWGLTLGPATGRLIAEMMTGATPFCDPKPYSADRFRP